MFGQNRKAPIEISAGLALRVNEIFRTIQGEGPLAGEPAVFVRLSGCNLRCFFCDTEFESGQLMTLIDIKARIHAEKKKGIDLCVITGGEPFLQNIEPLVSDLLSLGWRVQVETAGTVWQSSFDDFHEYAPLDFVVVCSPKTPVINPNIERIANDFKYIIRHDDPRDAKGIPITSTQREGQGAKPLFFPTKAAIIWVQPCFEYIEERPNFMVPDEQRNALNAKAAADIAIEHGYRLTLQLHKIVGLP